MIEPVKVSHVGRKEEPSPNNGWRRYGIERRKQLIEQDIAEGGNRFVLNFQCRIQGYFALSEKVSYYYHLKVNNRKKLGQQLTSFPFHLH
jgi:hypothetical protein